MKERVFKYTFFIVSGVILAVMLIASRDAGISGDEEVHYKHSEMVFNFFATLGEDKSALHTPVTHLQYYGQSFDNFVTILIRMFSVDDIYGFRHYMCAFAGWVTIFVTAWFAVCLAGYGAGILALVLFAVSPVFMGHAHNNLKDIPFALAYIVSVYFIAKAVFIESSVTRKTAAGLIIGIALAVGIRPGGILLVIYLLFFAAMMMAIRYFILQQRDPGALKKGGLKILIIAVAGYLCGLILWPYALQNPLVNPWKSYQVMTHFPTTIRQIFEGNFIWSDLLPWYYLPKMMFITTPLVIWAGILLFATLAWKHISSKQGWLYAFLLFTVLFPVVFAVARSVNLYGSWRHFLFVYPGIVLIAALGFTYLFKQTLNIRIRLAMAAGLILLAMHPVLFSIKNHPYSYLYYNQSVGGLRNVSGVFETDYYYHSVREATLWLTKYLEQNGIQEAVIGSNFSIAWHLRNKPGLKARYFAWDNRSSSDWDYAVVCNSYIHPYQLRNNLWPPVNTIHQVKADGVPICAVIKRTSKLDMEGIRELQNDLPTAIQLLHRAGQSDPGNEVIWYQLANAYKKQGNIRMSDSMLHKSLEQHPAYELSILMLGRNAESRGETSVAAGYYDRLIQVNPKYYLAYVLRSKLYTLSELRQAREVLKSCLRMNPKYKPAIIALADTYRESDPEIAEKYDNLANSIK